MGNTAHREWFSRPEDDARTRTAWERLLSGEGLPSRVRGLIDDSWRRCVSGQVDPLRQQAAPPLEHEALAVLRHEHARLISASTPPIAQARSFLSQTGTVMILTDARGTILSLEGDARIREPLGDIRLVPGATWAETSCGTNAIGTALALGQPVQIHAAEHFCTGIQRWTCSAAVIRDPIDGAILGAIDVSGLSRSYSRHALALAVTTADRIESQLGRLEMELRYRLLERCMRQLSAAGGDGVIVFDRRGRLVKANESAAAALAALGIPFALSAAARIDALCRDGVHPPAAALPEWLRADWLEPVVEGRELLGTLLRIPCTRSIAPLRLEPVVPDKAFARIVGHSPALHDALQKAQRLARAHVPVVLLGETGVGKELFARGIHEAGTRPGGPFVALNCGGLSRELLASELFGYAEGAFTGARRGGMTGKIEAANGGTLFLDEIGEMPLDLQPHFLRVLEEGEIYRVGENAPRKVDFRLVAATNRDLRNEVGDGRFRMDLFYRIAVTSIRIPPLRERREDIPALVESMLASLSRGAAVPTFEPATLAALERHDWPGNVRELRNVIESMVLMLGGDSLRVEDLPSEIFGGAGTALAATLPDRLEATEVEQIRQAIRATQGNLTQAARSLGIAKSTLYLKLKKYGLAEEPRETE